ncbi:hypothetical protein BCR42DRAFT_429550, partial [Absidia repens]
TSVLFVIIIIVIVITIIVAIIVVGLFVMMIEHNGRWILYVKIRKSYVGTIDSMRTGGCRC